MSRPSTPPLLEIPENLELFKGLGLSPEPSPTRPLKRRSQETTLPPIFTNLEDEKEFELLNSFGDGIHPSDPRYGTANSHPSQIGYNHPIISAPAPAPKMICPICEVENFKKNQELIEHVDGHFARVPTRTRSKTKPNRGGKQSSKRKTFKRKICKKCNKKCTKKCDCGKRFCGCGCKCGKKNNRRMRKTMKRRKRL